MAGRLLSYVNSGSAISLVHREVVDCLQLGGLINPLVKPVLGEERVDFEVRILAATGEAVIIKVRARIVDDLDVPLLIGSSDLANNNIDTGVRGRKRLSVRTISSPGEGFRTAGIELCQIRNIIAREHEIEGSGFRSS